MQPVRVQEARTHNRKHRRQPRQPADRQTCGATMTWTWKDCRTRKGAWASIERRELEAERHGVLTPALTAARIEVERCCVGHQGSPEHSSWNRQAQRADARRLFFMSCMFIWGEPGFEQPVDAFGNRIPQKDPSCSLTAISARTQALQSRYPHKRSIITAFRLAGDGTRVQVPSCTESTPVAGQALLQFD